MPEEAWWSSVPVVRYCCWGGRVAGLVVVVVVALVQWWRLLRLLRLLLPPRPPRRPRHLQKMILHLVRRIQAAGPRYPSIPPRGIPRQSQTSAHARSG